MTDPLRKGRTISGARAIFMVEGVELGYGLGVDAEEQILYEPAIVLNKMKVVEYIPVGYEVTTFTAQRLRLIDDSLRATGIAGMPQIFPKHGADDSELLSNILALDDIKCVLIDSHTNRTFALLEDVRVGSRGFRVAPRQLVVENIAFLAVTLRDETEANAV